MEEDVGHIDAYFREMKLPASVEWVDNAFDLNGIKAPPLTEENNALNSKLGGPPKNGEKNEEKKLEEDIPKLITAQEVEVGELKPIK